MNFQRRPEHSCCDNHGEGPSVYDLPIPKALRDEWLRLESRRHFLGRMGKALGWAGLAVLIGDGLLRGVSRASDGLPCPGSLYFPIFSPYENRGLTLTMSYYIPHMY